MCTATALKVNKDLELRFPEYEHGGSHGKIFPFTAVHLLIDGERDKDNVDVAILSKTDKISAQFVYLSCLIYTYLIIEFFNS